MLTVLFLLPLQLAFSNTLPALTKDHSIIIDKATRTVSFLAEVNGKYFYQPTRHFAVYATGSNGEKFLLRGLVPVVDLSAKSLIFMEILLIFLLFTVYRFDLDVLLVIPASTFKERFFLHSFHFFRLDYVLAAILVFCNCTLLPPRGLIRFRQEETDSPWQMTS